MEEAKGSLFFEEIPDLPLGKHSDKYSQFLKSISPLTARENECLQLLKLGHTSQSTAAILGLSKRTVEHYFDNIKMKLNCNSKRELLEF